MSVGGMLVTALMLGIVSETISDKIEDLKKGTSDVLEDNHRCCPPLDAPPGDWLRSHVDPRLTGRGLGWSA